MSTYKKIQKHPQTKRYELETLVHGSKVTRIEVIDHSGLGTGIAPDFGRILTKYYQGPVSISLSLQDDDRTFKIFISKPKDQITD